MTPRIARCIARTAALGTGLLLAGCAATTPAWDRHFGEATRAALASQIIDAQAARNPDPVSGMDGAAAHAALQGYQKSMVPVADPVAPAADTMGAK